MRGCAAPPHPGIYRVPPWAFLLKAICTSMDLLKVKYFKLFLFHDSPVSVYQLGDPKSQNNNNGIVEWWKCRKTPQVLKDGIRNDRIAETP